MWRGGCIIRSKFLGKIKEAFDRNPALSNLLLDDYFRQKVAAVQVESISTHHKTYEHTHTSLCMRTRKSGR